MTLPASGAISFNAINVELGSPGATSANINQASYRTLAGVPSGTIALSNFYVKSNALSITYTILAGGGGGVYYGGGGGGAGGMLVSQTASLTAGSYPVTVGAGGPTAQMTAPDNAPNGSNSSFNGQTAIGGGLGGNVNYAIPARSGGSGGGAPEGAGSGTPGQGNPGGSGAPFGKSGFSSAGGGGAGATGNSGSGSSGAPRRCNCPRRW